MNKLVVAQYATADIAFVRYQKCLTMSVWLVLERLAEWTKFKALMQYHTRPLCGK